MQNSKLYLITRADDVGTNHSANRATQEAYQKGILRNASLMVMCTGIEEAAKMLAGEKGLCFGMHLTVNAEWDTVKWGPVSPPEKVPSLVDEHGHFFQTTQELYDHKPQLEDFLAEMQAQLDRARDLGFDVKYADAHMGFTWILPTLVEELDRWCLKNSLLNPRNCYLRLPKVESAGDPVEQFIARLKAAEPGNYIVVGHPAYDNEEMRPLGHPGYASPKASKDREWERRIFMDPRVVDYCEKNGVVPLRFDEAEGM